MHGVAKGYRDWNESRVGTWNELRCISGPRLRPSGSLGARKGRNGRQRGCGGRRGDQGGLPPTYKLYALNEIYGWRFERDHCPSSLTSLPLYSSTWSRLCPLVNRPSSTPPASPRVPSFPEDRARRTEGRGARANTWEREGDGAVYSSRKNRGMPIDERESGSNRIIGALQVLSRALGGLARRA